MKEGVPKQQRSLEIATLGGTVEMPQVGLGIVLRAMEHCLMADDPRAEVEHLLDPIPLDDELLRRTEKANIQHRNQGVPMVAKPERVRAIQAHGNIFTLSHLAFILGGRRPDNIDAPSEFDSTGAWVEPWMQQDLKEVQSELSPDRIDFLRAAIGAASSAFSSPDVRELLAKRRVLLGTVAKSGVSADAAVLEDQIRRLTREVAALLDKHIREEVGEVDDVWQRSALTRLIKSLKETLPGSL